MKLDAKDRQLLAALYANSRASFAELGKKLNLSSTSVERRFERLRKEGVVKAFANVNLGRVGLKSYRIYLKFESMDRETEGQLLAFFGECERTIWCVVCEGEYDVLMVFAAKDEREAEGLMERLLNKFGERIAEKTLTVTLHQRYLAWNKALGTQRNAGMPVELSGGGSPPDEKDVKLLSLLYDNARETTVDLAKAVGLSPDAVHYRMKRLEKSGAILGYACWYDAKKLGFNYHKLLLGFRKMTAEKEARFVAYCSEKDDVVFINKTLGSWDMELDIIARDSSELHAFVQDIKSKFGEIIGRHYVVSVISERVLNPLR